MSTTTLSKTRNVNYKETSIRYPEEMSFVFTLDDQENTLMRDALFLYPYVVQGKLSTGRVAEIIGTDRLSVMDFYESNGLPWLSYTADDLRDDIETLRKLHERE